MSPNYVMESDLLLAATTAADLTFYLLFERFELRSEVGEECKVGIFLYDMVHEAHGKYEFLGMFVLFKPACGFSSLHHGGEIMMTAEIEVDYFGHFTVFGLDDVDVIRFLIHNFSVFYELSTGNCPVVDG